MPGTKIGPRWEWWDKTWEIVKNGWIIGRIVLKVKELGTEVCDTLLDLNFKKGKVRSWKITCLEINSLYSRKVQAVDRKWSL